MDENMLHNETVMNFRPKLLFKEVFYDEPAGSILCSDYSIEDMCDIKPSYKRPIINADFMNKAEETYSRTSQKAVFVNETPRRFPCSDMPIEDVCIFKNTKRPKMCPEFMDEIEAAHPESEKADYENQIIDMKRKVVDSETEYCRQTRSCTFDSPPCRQESCWPLKTIAYNNNFKNDLHDQLLGNKKKEMKKFSYSFNMKMYSGIENIKKERFVAKGGFGKVVKCSDSKTKCLLIMKKSKKDVEIEPNEVEIPLLFQNELNIAQVLGCFSDGHNFYIIQEDAGVSLNKLKDQCEFLKKHREILIFSLQLFAGVNTLAKNSITHWDLKPENVCLNIRDDKSFLLKLIDFGSCQTNKDKKRLTGHTPEYLPPDFNKAYYEARKQLSQNKDSTPYLQLISSLNSGVDIWAAGLIILYIYKKQHPMMQYFQKELSGFKDKEERKEENIRLIGQLTDPLDDYFTTGNETIDHLLSQILVVNRDARWKASEILKYIQGELEKLGWHQKFAEKQKSEKNVDMDIDIKNERKRTALHDKKLEISLNEMKLQMSVSSVIQETDELEDFKNFNLQMKPFNCSAIEAQHSKIDKSHLCFNETIRTECQPMENVFVNQKPPSLSLAQDKTIPRFDILLGNEWANGKLVM